MTVRQSFKKQIRSKQPQVFCALLGVLISLPVVVFGFKVAYDLRKTHKRLKMNAFKYGLDKKKSANLGYIYVAFNKATNE